MQHAPRTVDDIIDTLGGTAAVARLTGTRAQTVSNWRARRSIPAAYWSALVSNSPKVVSYDALAEACFTERKQFTPDCVNCHQES